MREAPLLALRLLQFELVDQIHDAVEAAALALLDRVAGDGDGQMGLAGAGPPTSTTLRASAMKPPV